jgi:hypothetical protein
VRGSQQAGRDVEAGHDRSAALREVEQQAAAAAHVEQPGPGRDAGRHAGCDSGRHAGRHAGRGSGRDSGRGEDRLEQRPGVRLGEPGPALGVSPPELLLLEGRGRQRGLAPRAHDCVPGAMSWPVKPGGDIGIGVTFYL